MYLLDETSCGDVIVERLDSPEWAEGVQGSAGEYGDGGPGFCKSVVDRDQSDQHKEKDLDDLADPDIPPEEPVSEESFSSGCAHNIFSLSLF